MKKTGFVALIVMALFLTFSFTSVFATDTTMTNDAMNMARDGVDGVRNVVGDVENGIENVAGGVTGAVRNGFNTATSDTRNAADDIGRTASDSDYTATRTSTDAGDAGFFGMSANTLTWVVLAITGIALVVLLWSYFSSAKSNTPSDY